MKFEWDAARESENLTRHGVDFVEARQAFLDPLRIITVDAAHSETEPRFFCIGRTDRGVLTVRYTRRADAVRLIGAGYWRKGRNIYEKENS